LCSTVPGAISVWLGPQEVCGEHIVPRVVALKVLAMHGAQAVPPGLLLIAPTGQSLQAVALVVVLIVPGAQGAHTRSLLGVAATMAYEPAWHVEYGRQSLSLVGVPEAARYCSAVHTVQGVQAVAFAAVVKPDVQRVHIRSTVVEPAMEMKSPGLQLLHAAQIVTGFASLSHWPEGHGPPCCAPPGQ
jgi:hypothetical protein